MASRYAWAIADTLIRRAVEEDADGRRARECKALADGHAFLKAATFTGLLAEANSRIASATATIEARERQIGKTIKRVTPELVDAFGKLVRDRLSGDGPALRKACVALFVSKVAIDREAIRISPNCSNARLGELTRP